MEKIQGYNIIIYLLCIFSLTLAMHYPVPEQHQNKDWMKTGQDELRHILKKTHNTNVAKNVILFIGDGMGLTTVWASRVYTGQRVYGQSGEEYEIEFEKFDHVGLAKTYNTESQVPDSAATATAILSGVKSNSRTVGVNERVTYQNCSNQEDEKLDNIMDWSLERGKSIGILTTTRLTHATTAAMYAHCANRDWECDADMDDPSNGDPEYNKRFHCRDIARQLIEDGGDINVLMGGGLSYFLPKDINNTEYGNVEGKRLDNRDLIQEWKTKKTNNKKQHAFVSNKDQLDEIDVDKTDDLLGLFTPSHMQFDVLRNKTTEPSLAEMTQKAIQILKKNNKGFFLLVEGGRIDHGHHLGMARLALHDAWAFEEAVKIARGLTNTDDTLIVATADHSHSFTTAGYSTRGTDILGSVDRDSLGPPTDGLPHLILTYANGPGAPYNNSFGRRDHTGVDTTAPTFKQDAITPMKYETHGGEDVPVYAHGPMSHLFNGVYEQNYLAHAMAYASCVGPNYDHCLTTYPPANSGHILFQGFHTCALLLVACFLIYYQCLM